MTYNVFMVMLNPTHSLLWYSWPPLCQMQPWASCCHICGSVTSSIIWYQPMGSDALQLGRLL